MNKKEMQNIRKHLFREFDGSHHPESDIDHPEVEVVGLECDLQEEYHRKVNEPQEDLVLPFITN